MEDPRVIVLRQRLFCVDYSGSLRYGARHIKGRLPDPGTESVCRVIHRRDNALCTRRIRGDRSGGNTLRIENRKAGSTRAISAAKNSRNFRKRGS
jgi:hypothetical protein